jgi:hypothetical protein
MNLCWLSMMFPQQLQMHMLLQQLPTELHWRSGKKQLLLLVLLPFHVLAQQLLHVQCGMKLCLVSTRLQKQLQMHMLLLQLPTNVHWRGGKKPLCELLLLWTLMQMLLLRMLLHAPGSELPLVLSLLLDDMPVVQLLLAGLLQLKLLQNTVENFLSVRCAILLLLLSQHRMQHQMM